MPKTRDRSSGKSLGNDRGELFAAGAVRRRRSFVPKNILLILTDPTVAEEIRRALSRSDDGPFQVDWVRTRADGLARLLTQGKQHDHAPTGIAAVLAELFLLDSEGIETFDCLHAVVPDIPILVL